MNSSIQSDKAKLITTMAIFGTIGIFRRYIPLPSSLIALGRGMIASVFLLMVLFLQKKSLDKTAIRNNMRMLFISGTTIGINWILLFESYCYTSVATATLCYYLAPILMILGAAIVLKEKLTIKQGLCAAAALCGMIPVSGVLNDGAAGPNQLKGILLGIGAAILYACVILMNKKMNHINAYDKTILQLFFASVTLLPYVLVTEDFGAICFTPRAVFFLLLIGVVHTGFAYWMYFSSIEHLAARTVAIWSYLDPVLAIILSNLVLKEPMGLLSWFGAAVILGSAYLCER